MNTVQLNMNTQIQPSKKDKKAVKPYLEAQGTIQTEDKVHPLPPQGHLIHDNIGNSVKYFFKDIGYDMKSLKNGFNGTANDHQLGRHNDVGISLAGILIATYLASQTANPRARVMEYVGLGAFLTAMSIYPKIAINTPAKLLHGYDIDKEFIDDQGRKKSVMQDSNYVPYDMYLGEVPDEDMALIGDKMGIPRNIKNRNDVTREQMRKIATQSNTLWMLTAGVTPAFAALLCCGIENYIAGPLLEKAGIQKYSAAVSKALNKTKDMPLDVDSIKSNKLSSDVEKLLTSFKGEELPKEEFEKLVNLVTENMYENTREGVREDLAKILGTSAGGGSESVVITNETISEMINSAKDSISKANKESLEKVLVPTKEEIETIIKRYVPVDADFGKGTTTKLENVAEIKAELKNLINSKMQNASEVPQEFLNSQRNNILENISKSLKAQKSSFVSDESIKQIVDFAKIMGEFKDNQKFLTECKNFNFEYINETILARSYAKFEKTLLNELEIKFSDLKKMRESEQFTKEILDKKFTEIANDDARYKKTLEKLGKVISDMEVKLHGKDESSSRVLDLITAIENNYNNTAKRLDGIGTFKTTINRLVKEDVKTLKPSIDKMLFENVAGSTEKELSGREKVFDFIDGIAKNKYPKNFEWYKSMESEAENNAKNELREAYVKYSSNGLGSSKNLEIGRILERYQGAKNSFNRIIHTFDVYKRALSPEAFAESLAGKNKDVVNKVIEFGKETLLNASSSEHNMKLNTVNNPTFYKDVMWSVWANTPKTPKEVYNSTKAKGLITDSTKEALGKYNNIGDGNVLDRFQYYISRFRNIVSNSDIDFTKPRHILDSNIRSQYTQAERTRMAFFSLIGQTPVDMAKNAAKARYSAQKWVRMIAGITGGVFGIALISQFFFGKLSNPHNLQKQVSNDTSK